LKKKYSTKYSLLSGYLLKLFQMIFKRDLRQNKTKNIDFGIQERRCIKKRTAKSKKEKL
jgi:hypothetical protein